MDILSYTGKVKTFSESELHTFLAGILVSTNDLLANIENLRANNLEGAFDEAANSWVLTKSILKYIQDKGFRGSSLLGDIEFGLNSIKHLLPGLEKLIKGYNTKVWDGKLITLRQVNILNTVEYINYWLEYTGNLVDVCLTIHLNKVDPNKYLSVHDQKWMTSTQDFYKHFTVELLKGGRIYLQTLDKIPDAEVSDISLDVLETSHGKDSTDLIKKGFGIHNLNPVFWFGLAAKNVNLFRIDNMRAKNQKYAMKISQAINRRDGTNDPQIDREIEIYQEKIIKNEWQIDQIIKSYE